MAGEKTAKSSLPPWIVNICTWLWGYRSFVWTTIGLGTLLGIFTGWLFADPSSYTRLPVYWLYLNRGYVLMGFIILVELFALSYVVSLVPAAPSAPRRVAKNIDISYYYRLTNQFLSTEQSLEVESDGTYGLMMARTEDHKKSQFWKLVELGKGKYALQSASLGKSFSLEATNDDISNAPCWMGTTEKHNKGQVWTLLPRNDGTYKLANDLIGYDKFLDIYAGGLHRLYFSLGLKQQTGQNWTLTRLGKISE